MARVVSHQKTVATTADSALRLGVKWADPGGERTGLTGRRSGDPAGRGVRTRMGPMSVTVGTVSLATESPSATSSVLFSTHDICWGPALRSLTFTRLRGLGELRQNLKRGSLVRWTDKSRAEAEVTQGRVCTQLGEDICNDFHSFGYRQLLLLLLFIYIFFLSLFFFYSQQTQCQHRDT